MQKFELFLDFAIKAKPCFSLYSEVFQFPPGTARTGCLAGVKEGREGGPTGSNTWRNVFPQPDRLFPRLLPCTPKWF